MRPAHLLLLVCLLATSACGRSEEAQVRKTIQAVADGARAGDLGATMKPVAKDYSTEDGTTRNEIKGYLFREFQRRKGIAIVLSPINVVVDGETARAQLTVAMADGIDVGSWDLLPNNADLWDFDVELRKEGRKWLITGSEQGPVQANGQ